MSRFAVVVVGIFSFCECLNPCPLRAAEAGHQSANFVVSLEAGGPAPERVATLCESLKTELCRVWCDGEQEVWNPPCEIVVHATLAKYVHAVGQNGVQTLGSSLIRVEGGHVLSRRIDLLVDSAGDLPALPHELTHVVMSERFGGHQPPHWFDEGAAMLADTKYKQSLHERDCRDALRSGSAMPLSVLLRLEQFTSAEQMPAFYGQSASLMRFLCKKGGFAKVTQFASDSLRVGYQQALRHNYGIDSVDDLEKRWKRYAYSGEATPPKLAAFTISFSP